MFSRSALKFFVFRDPTPRRRRLWSVVLPLLVMTAGCQREEIAVYDAPKDSRPPAPASLSSTSPVDSAGGPRESMTMPPRPGIRWKDLPAGWTSRGATGMRVANFSIAGSGENAAAGSADLAIIPLPGTGGTDLDLVNLWRSQLALGPIEESALPAHTEETTVAGQAVRLFQIVGSAPGDAVAAGNQILVAALRRDGFTWFFKLGGDKETVAANREPLKSFLSQVEFTAPEPSSAPVASSSQGSPGPMPKATWQAPETWKSQPAPQMVHSKWTVATPDGSSFADVTVSVFPGETGGLPANLTRWRSQVGLSPGPDSEPATVLNNVDVLGGKGTMVDYTGTNPEDGEPRRLVGVIVRRDGYSWFYKLLGSSSAVQAHKDAFVRFAQSVQYTRGS